jgi:hypothetical protein
MADIVKLRNTAQELRSFAQHIRRNNEAAPYPTAALDAGLLERAAQEMEEAASEIERLRGSQSK